MKFDITSEIHYQVIEPGSVIILNIHALRSPNQAVLHEEFSIEPYFKAEELLAVQGENRLIRIEIPQATLLTIKYQATVDTAFKVIDFSHLEPIPVGKLDPQVLPYLYPSRYCQSDKLFRFAGSKFGGIDNTFEQVLALTNWIYLNVEYLSGSTNSQTSAYDTVTEQAGVCRDFAHLGIALCRALNIPARYFTGYAFKLFPPDFHACFEAYIGGDWVIFDATKLAPLNGLVKIATGRDAADTAVASIFGNVLCPYINVSSSVVEPGFEGMYYKAGESWGISYL